MYPMHPPIKGILLFSNILSLVNNSSSILKGFPSTFTPSIYPSFCKLQKVIYGFKPINEYFDNFSSSLELSKIIVSFSYLKAS